MLARSGAGGRRATSASSASSSAARSSSRICSPISIATSAPARSNASPRCCGIASRRSPDRSTGFSAGISSTIWIARRRRRWPSELSRVLRPDGALLGFFATAQTNDPRYTKYVIADEGNLRHRSYPAARCRQTILFNRDIIRLFPDAARVRLVPAAEQSAGDSLPQARMIGFDLTTNSAWSSSRCGSASDDQAARFLITVHRPLITVHCLLD